MQALEPIIIQINTVLGTLINAGSSMVSTFSVGLNLF
ncbi:hypothetical protein CCHOA_10725 [Corynebacterium choanae]|uniref:Uncharacterized protein n=1 Tax=Corynebacterium choanae TaxID=1862358 RepID=A0A3G6JEF5_9CORY|nr:hypothetical protein CCHOA_10725 [Corynebacterium choanae]